MISKNFKSSITLKVSVAISLILYVCSLFQTGITYLDYNGQGSFTSIELLIVSGIGILGGGLLEWVIWLANPFFFYSIYFIIKGRKEALYFVGFSGITALIFRTWNEILVAENGRNAAITSFDLGYYLWLSSFIVLLIGTVAYKAKLQHPTKLIQNPR